MTNFTSFAPLGVVLVALLGVGVAERSGLITACIRGLVLKAASFKPLPAGKGFGAFLMKPINFVINPKTWSRLLFVLLL